MDRAGRPIRTLYQPHAIRGHQDSRKRFRQADEHRDRSHCRCGQWTGSSPTTREPAPRAPQTACAPSRLFTVFTEFASAGNVPAGWPQIIAVKVVDDCGSPMTTGTVVATFSNGDPPLALINLQNSAWTGTWQPGNVNASTVQVRRRPKVRSRRATWFRYEE